jgi:hypothetical protein
VPATNLSLSVSSQFEHLLAWIGIAGQGPEVTTMHINDADDVSEEGTVVATDRGRSASGTSNNSNSMVIVDMENTRDVEASGSSSAGNGASTNLVAPTATRAGSRDRQDSTTSTTSTMAKKSFADVIADISRSQHASSELELISVYDLATTTWTAVKHWQLGYIQSPYRTYVTLESGEVLSLRQLPPGNSFHLLLHRFLAAAIMEAGRYTQHVKDLQAFRTLLQANESDVLLMLSIALQPLLLASEVRSLNCYFANCELVSNIFVNITDCSRTLGAKWLRNAGSESELQH